MAIKEKSFVGRKMVEDGSTEWSFKLNGRILEIYGEYGDCLETTELTITLSSGRTFRLSGNSSTNFPFCPRVSPNTEHTMSLGAQPFLEAPVSVGIVSIKIENAGAESIFPFFCVVYEE